MALIMLAIGGLLALVGVYAIASGFPVIEVERGWSMVISGAVLLSGGLIVAALGIVVRTINGLKAGFPVAAVAALPPHDEPTLALPVEAPRPPAFEPAPVVEQAPAIAVAVPAAAAVLAAGAGHVAGLHDSEAHERELATHRESDPAAPEPTEASAERAATEADVVGHEPPARAPFGQAWHEQDFSAFDLDAAHEPTAARTPEPEPEPKVAPAPHGLEPTPAERHEPESYELPVEPPEPPSQPAFHEPEPVAHEPERIAHEPEPVAAHSPEPAPEPVAEAPATAPDTPPGGLSVIGRYDSDGTSYVMYSDGSIEAQSEAGVFRFNSMAELKAFIEG